MGTAVNFEDTNTSKEEANVTKLWKEVRELSLGWGSDVECLHLPPSPIQFLRDFVTDETIMTMIHFIGVVFNVEFNCSKTTLTSSIPSKISRVMGVFLSIAVEF